jgi:hypothetical protein
MMGGMMGQGEGGMMNPGMMNQGMMGQGTMGQGMMGGYPMMGPMMMGGYPMMMGPMMMPMGGVMGPMMMPMGGMMGSGMMMGPNMMMGWGGGTPQTANLNLSVNDVTAYLGRWVTMMANPHIKVGSVTEKETNTITADIVTTDKDALVQRFDVDRRTGVYRPAQ